MNVRCSLSGVVALACVVPALTCGGQPSPGFAGGGASGSPASSGGSSDTAEAGAREVDGGGPPATFGDGGLYDGGGMSLDSGCATATATAQRQPVYMLFVLDGSHSMNQHNKWVAVVPALEAIFDDMKTKADPGVGAGLIAFADSLDHSAASGFGPYPERGIDVPVTFVNVSQDTALHQRLAGTPGNITGTPTHAALTGGYSELESFSPMPPLLAGGKKVVVLITDGVPTDDCKSARGPYPTNACVQLAAMKLAEAAPLGPILTYVIGVGIYPGTGMGFDPAFLGNVALAGGSGPTGCNPNENAAGANDLCYFQVDPTQVASAGQLQQAFENAINAIRGQVLSCTFPLQLTGAGKVDPAKVNVEVNGMTVPQNAANGWSYDNPASPTQIVLNGLSCVNLKNDPHAMVQIVLGCQTVVAQ
jgi:hypothetical protein